MRMGLTYMHIFPTIPSLLLMNMVYAERHLGGFIFNNPMLIEGTNNVSFQSLLGGVSHGVADFTLGTLHDFHNAAVHIGSSEWDINVRFEMFEAIDQFQSNNRAALSNKMMGLFSD